MTLDEIVKSLDLKKLRRSGNGYTACCPAHDDHRPSLSIFVGDDGNPGNPRVHFKCYRGCDERAILNALGLEFRDLYLNERPSEEKQHKVIYHYTDAQGKEIARKVRKPGKKFIWLHPDEKGGFINGTGDAKIPLYRLPEVMAASEVYLVEGEKDADNLRRLGKVATTTPSGAGSKWQDNYTDTLKDKSVIIIADNDEPGRKHAKNAADKLKNEALSVKMIDPRQVWAEIPEHGDTSDILTHFGAAEGLKRIEALAESTAENTDPDEKRLEVISARELQQKDIPPLEFIIEGILPRGGLAILSAAPKTGKSWYVLDMCLSVAMGKPFLGRKANIGECLYLALEDSERRLKGRMNKLLRREAAPAGFYYATSAADLENGLTEQLGNHIKAHPETSLIVIDTLAKVRPAANGKDSAYANDYHDLGILKDFADKHNVAVFLVHHIRKMTDASDPFNRVSGTNGITGTADTALIIEKESRDSEEAKLTVTGRDIETVSLVIRFDNSDFRWKVVGSAEEIERERAKQEYDKNPIVRTIKALLEKADNGKYAPEWRGTATELLNECREHTGGLVATSAQSLASQLKKISAQLWLYDTITYRTDPRSAKGRKHVFVQDPYWSEVVRERNIDDIFAN